MSDSSKKKRGHHRTRVIRNTLFGLLVSGGCLVWLFRSMELEDFMGQFENFRLEYLLLAIICTALSYLLRAWRWPHFFRQKPPGFADSYRCLILGFFMNNVLPVRMGELVRAHLGGRATHQSRTHVLATIAAERLADGVTISLLFAVLFSLGSQSLRVDEGRVLFAVAYLFFGAALGTFGLLIVRRKVFHLLEKLHNRLPGSMSTYTLVRIRRFIEGLEPLMKVGRVLQLGIMSAVVWGVELAVYYFVTRAFNQDLGIGGLALFLAAVNFSSLVPAAPGGIGVIEAFATLALVHIGIHKETAFAMVAVQHAIQIGVVAVPGLYFFITNFRGRLPSAIEGEETEFSEPGVVESANSVDIPSSSLDDKRDGVFVSLVIPAFNEEHRLPQALSAAIAHLRMKHYLFEIIVVDDGSSDSTYKVVERFMADNQEVKCIRLGTNRGKGFAVKTGMLAAVGEYILFADADGSTPIAEIEKLLSAAQAGADIAIGSRAMHSTNTSVDALWYRKAMGRTFNTIVNIVLLPGVHDTQCGFKLFRQDAARRVFPEQRVAGFSFDVEVLYLARCAGFSIVEIPINWSDIPGSKVNLLTDSARMFVDIFRIRARGLLGVYRR